MGISYTQNHKAQKCEAGIYWYIFIIRPKRKNLIFIGYFFKASDWVPLLIITVQYCSVVAHLVYSFTYVFHAMCQTPFWSLRNV